MTNYQVNAAGSMWQVREIETKKVVAFCNRYEEARHLARKPSQIAKRSKALRERNNDLNF